MNYIFAILGGALFGCFISILFTIATNVPQKKTTQLKPEIKPFLTYTEAMDILDQLIKFTVSYDLEFLNLQIKDHHEISAISDELLTTVCTDIYEGISNDLKRQLLHYTTDQYIEKYISRTTRVLLVVIIESKRKSK